MEARFFAPVQTGPEAHPASCKMGTGSFPGVKCGRGVTLTNHPLLVPWSRKSRAIPLLPLRSLRPVQSLSACTRVHFIFYSTSSIYIQLRPSGEYLTNYVALLWSEVGLPCRRICQVCIVRESCCTCTC